MINENEDAAAVPAAEEATTTTEVTTDAVVHPTNPPVPPDPVPEPNAVSDSQDAAHEEIPVTLQPQRFITLGETVYYGDGSGQVWPAMIVHVYGRAADADEDKNDTYVDLQVFKRKSVCDVERVAQHSLELDQAGPLTGWVFKA